MPRELKYQQTIHLNSTPMSQYRHIMYASASHIRQIFSEKYGDVSQIDLESTEEVSSTIEGKLGALVTSISGDLSGGISQSEIKKINFDDEMFQTKKVVNDLLEDEEIPPVSKLNAQDGAPTGLYRFSSEVVLKPVESGFDDENYIEVAGYEGDVKFRGITSLDNWGSRSNLLTAMRADTTYPFQGVLTPVARNHRGIETEEFDVQFLFICAPESESLQRWYNRTELEKELLDQREE